MASNSSNTKIVVWEWLNDYFRWNAYPSHIACFIEQNRNNKKKVYLKDVDVEYSLYCVDYCQLKQVREIHGNAVSTRDIRRSLYPSTSLPARGVQWQWEADNRRKWHHFDLEVAELLERSHDQNCRDTIDLSQYPYGMPYTVSLVTMTQTRVGTGRSRPIRRQIITTKYPIDGDISSPGEGVSNTSNVTSTVSVKTEINNGVVTVESTSVNKKGESIKSVVTTTSDKSPGARIVVTNETRYNDVTSATPGTKIVTTYDVGDDVSNLSSVGKADKNNDGRKTHSYTPAMPTGTNNQSGGCVSTCNTGKIGCFNRNQPTHRQQQSNTFNQLMAEFKNSGNNGETVVTVDSDSDDNNAESENDQDDDDQPIQISLNNNVPNYTLPTNTPTVTSISTVASNYITPTITQPKKTSPDKPVQTNSLASKITSLPPQIKKEVTDYTTQPVIQTNKTTEISMNISNTQITPPDPILSVPSNDPESDTETNYCPIKQEKDNDFRAVESTLIDMKPDINNLGISGQPNQEIAVNTDDQNTVGIATSNAESIADTGPKTRFRKNRRPVVNTTPAKRKRKSEAVGVAVGPTVVKEEGSTAPTGRDGIVSFVEGKMVKVKNNVAATSKKIKGHDVDTMLNNYTEPVLTSLKDLDCSICRDSLSEHSTYETNNKYADVVKFSKCSHSYHRACLRQLYISSKSCGYIVCAECKTIHGIKTGTCPCGVMQIERLDHHLPGHPDCSTICVMYYIKDGKQGNEHPNPGCRYTAVAFPRVCYLPNNESGKKVLMMLVVAWKRRLTFTVGTSTTSGLTDVVTWNEIHHKTESGPSRGGHGYPDQDYLGNVTAELAAHGVTEADIAALSSSDFT